MNLDEIKTGVCDDLVRGISTRGFRSFIETQFKYPDGDFIVLYLEGKGARTQISDLGTTAYKLKMDNIDLTSDRHAQLITGVCNLYGVTFSGRKIRRPIQQESVSLDFLAICEAILRISNLEFEVVRRQHTALRSRISNLLAADVGSRRKLDSDWFAPFDDNHSAPVDFRLNTVGEPRHIFHVASQVKSERVFGITCYLRLHDIDVPTMSIVDDRVFSSLTRGMQDRLGDVCEIVRGVAGNEPSIVEFALSGMNE